LSADGTENNSPLAASDDTEEDGDEGEGDHPVQVASIEELPASGNGGPALAGKHGKVPMRGKTLSALTNHLSASSASRMHVCNPRAIP